VEGTLRQGGIFENIMRDTGPLFEERRGYRLYECYIDCKFCKACGNGYGIGCTKAGRAGEIMVPVDTRGLPVAVTIGSASCTISRGFKGLFDFMLTAEAPRGHPRQGVRQRQTRRRA
jgi:hypothetical protein